ncbi:hypothetical protein A3L09_05250 [Thermococcus profundus]|uniref:Probable membrane transporter protein n=2 Tax=Thermococcus profundus TaxID=49899 RepID=A0A2Z2MDC5_THEPR|nr:hypothetical protein A3L09_05250 [Thermococcus profundus]
MKKTSSAWVSGVGFFIGVYIGILGIASTLIVIAALKAFFGMDMLKANGTAKALIFFNNFVATAVYGLRGLDRLRPASPGCRSGLRWRVAWCQDRPKTWKREAQVVYRPCCHNTIKAPGG